MEKTIKLRAYSKSAKPDAAPDSRALLAEEQNKTRNLLKEVVRLRESLKQEQAKAAGLEAKSDEISARQTAQLEKVNAQLDEERRLSLEYMRTVSQLRDSLQQEQAKTAELANRADELEGKTRKLAALEARIKELSGRIGRIAAIAAEGASASGK